MPRIDFNAEDTELLNEHIVALALVVLEEINGLRAQHGLSARTRAQLTAAIKAKVRALRET